jgi:hypothetical protein
VTLATAALEATRSNQAYPIDFFGILLSLIVEVEQLVALTGYRAEVNDIEINRDAALPSGALHLHMYKDLTQQPLIVRPPVDFICTMFTDVATIRDRLCGLSRGWLAT